MNSLILVIPAAVAGLALGLCSGRLAVAYDQALVNGEEPNARTLLHALRHAACGLVNRNVGRARSSAPMAGANPRSVRHYTMTGGIVLAAALGWACMVHGWSLHFLFLAAVSFILCCLAQIDWRTGLLPDALNYPLLAIGLAGAALAISRISLPASVQGALLGFGFLWLLTWLFKAIRNVEGMGRGDFKLAAAIGACAGSYDLVTILFLASLGGVAFGMAHQRTLRPAGSYPFGPFLAGAALVVMHFGG